MSLFAIVSGSAALLLLAYVSYGRLLSRLLKLRPDVATPAVTLRDDVDYVPIDSKYLFGQHFSAIAAAGPIVGPILAGIAFGWVPALIWILVGAIFIGGVHDITSLVASIRHQARSIAEVVREHMNRRSYILFLTFVWVALVYIIVAFTDVTADSFHGLRALENGDAVNGGGIATSSLLYLGLSMLLGLIVRLGRFSDNGAVWLTVLFLPLVGGSIWLGQIIPLDVEALAGWSPRQAQQFWNIALLVYCLVASVLPMWLLLQPRGNLGGYFLYAALATGAIGVMFGQHEIRYPQFTGLPLFDFDPTHSAMAPLLFITIACGACSGFHSIIASGTTSKQLRHETDARVVGYGAMLLEALVAVVSLSCVMILAKDSPLLAGKPAPNLIYAQGLGSFMQLLGVSAMFGVSFGLMAFTTFVYDTLDVCTRLGRYILQELTGWGGSVGRWVTTLISAGVPLIFLIWQPVSAQGEPAWKLYWNLFGASNQLLAALTLVGVTVWLWRTTRQAWVFVVTGLPCVFMYVMSMWALVRSVWPLVAALREGRYSLSGEMGNPVPWVAVLLISLGALLLIEAIFALLRKPDHTLPAATSQVALAPS